MFKRRLAKYGVWISADALCVAAALAISLTLSHNFQLGLFNFGTYFLTSFVLSVVAITSLQLLGVYRIDSRYFGLYDAYKILLVGILIGFVQLALNQTRFVLISREVHYLFVSLFVLLSLSLMIGVRVFYRRWLWGQAFLSSHLDNKTANRTLIMGAGDAGELILRDMQRSHSPRYHVLGFVDDNPERRRLVIHGVAVIGTSQDIPSLVESRKIDTILIAIPSASGGEMRRVLEQCHRTNARVLTLPSWSSVLDGNKNLSYSLREVEIEDLLRREPVRTSLEDAEQYLTGENVLITGGGGSIGSELARQVAGLRPSSLILVGKGENSLYEVEQELIQTMGVRPAAIVADVRDLQAMELIFARYKPTVIFHAAAHKHVPLMQDNSIEAFKNNVLGTLNTVKLALKYRVKKFILISTDKAVNPSSIMGATKRVAEMIVESLAREGETEFATVRFGNVLGSRGSLIPLLKSQIKRGGPVTITHKDMTRFFMTIPEAVQLILQSGSMGRHGEIFILDMGEPVRIVELAEDLIRLHGLIPNQDIPIHFVGVRPGEKMNEELVYSSEQLSATKHDKIRVVKLSKKDASNKEWLEWEIAEMLRLCDEGKGEKVQSRLMQLALGKAENVHLPSIEQAIVEDPIGNP